MQYKNLRSTHPREVTRTLRRLWSVKVFDGEPLDETPVITHTVVAMNEIDAQRKAGRHIAERPTFLHYVTWAPLDDPGGAIYRIENTTDGPFGEPITPSVALPEDDEWNF